MGRTGEQGDSVMPRHTWGLFRRSLEHHLLVTSPQAKVALAQRGLGPKTLRGMIEDLGPCSL
eukprot:2920753-Rhodomonas_salina.1